MSNKLRIEGVKSKDITVKSPSPCIWIWMVNIGGRCAKQV